MTQEQLHSDFLCLHCRQPADTKSLHQAEGDFLMRGYCANCQKYVVVITGRGVGLVVDDSLQEKNLEWKWQEKDYDWP